MVTKTDSRMVDPTYGFSDVGQATDVFFSNTVPAEGQTSATMTRFHGRVFGGESAGFTGATTGNNGDTHSWLADTPTDATSAWMEVSARAIFTTPIGLGVVGGGHLASTVNASRSVFGLGGIAWNEGNPSAYDARGWGLYVESHHGPLTSGHTGYTHIAELQIANYESDTAALTPSGTVAASGAFGVTIGSGVDPNNSGDVYAVSWALRIEGTGGTFASGIVFRDDALQAWGDGRTKAMLLPRTSEIAWFDASSNQVGAITTTATGAANAQKIELTNSGIGFYNDAGHPFVFFNNGPNSAQVNYASFTSNGTGSAPVISAAGVDTDVDLSLSGKGAGNIRFGTHAALAAETVTGYITIKDSGGTVRKLAVVS